MIKHLWTVLCERSILDSNLNLISLINVVERINAEVQSNSEYKEGNKLAFPTNLDVVSTWYRLDSKKEESAEICIEVFDTNNERLATFNEKITFPESVMRFRTRVHFDQMVFTYSGVYKIISSLRKNSKEDWNKVHELPVEIDLKVNVT